MFYQHCEVRDNLSFFYIFMPDILPKTVTIDSYCTAAKIDAFELFWCSVCCEIAHLHTPTLTGCTHNSSSHTQDQGNLRVCECVMSIPCGCVCLRTAEQGQVLGEKAAFAFSF